MYLKIGMHEALFYKKLDDRSVECRLCSHFCVIKNGQTGICRARKNDNGVLYSLVYGYPLDANVDPVEKKPLFHFFPGSSTYSFGTLGCNFACANCQNWNISQAKTLEKKIKDLNFVTPERMIEEALANDCVSISYTYNEPTVFAEYALDIMKLARKSGLKNVWVSNGYMSEDCLSAIIPHLDAINVDLKSIDNDFYKANCEARLDPVLENLKMLKQEQVHLEITTLIIPSLSANSSMLNRVAEFIAGELDVDVPWHVTRFSPSLSWKLKSLAPTADDLIYEACEIGREAGLKYVYAGNIPGDQKENTYCPKCGEIAIRRMGYSIERLDAGGRCAYCDRDLNIIE